jgi:DNA helicase-2/ATP-dependent DNA helicase PcrA
MRGFRDLISEPPDKVIREVLKKSGYHDMLAKSDDPDDENRLANVEELISAARETDKTESAVEEGPGQFEASDLEKFLEKITLVSDQDAYNEQQDQVAVMTLHAAKGLEFPVVFMMATEEGLLPHSRSQDSPEELEEERRLAFVGITRAEEELTLSYAKVREFRGSFNYTVPSSFLDELGEDGVKFDDNTSVGLDRNRRSFAADEEEEEDYGGGYEDDGPRHHRRRQEQRPAPTRQFASYGGERKPATPRGKPKDAVQGKAVREGVVVEHNIYGKGKVMELSGSGSLRKVRIRFPKFGDKLFILEKASIKVLGASDDD